MPHETALTVAPAQSVVLRFPGAAHGGPCSRETEAEPAEEPVAEAERLDALRFLEILDTLPDARFDRIVRLAAAHLEAPIVRLSFVDSDRVWTKASIGLDAKQAPRDISICSRVIESPEPLVVSDLMSDPRFRDYPQVTGGPRFRAYAGAPIVVAGGFRIGALCVIDRRPRPDIGAADMAFLEDLAALVVDALEAHRQTIERQKRLEAARRDVARAESAKRRFLSIVSHELRTPLNAISGFSEVIAGELFGPHSTPEYKDYALHMRAASCRLGALVERVLTYTAAETRALDLIETDVDLAAMLRKCVALTRAAKTENGRPEISLEVAVNAPASVRADEAHLTQIVMEILENAVAHSDPRSRIAVQASRAPGGGLALSVVDCGPGVPPGDIARLTEAFTQADERLERRREGAGLGLALVKTLAEMHGGQLSIKNRRAGGTVVEIALPAWRSRPEAADA